MLDLKIFIWFDLIQMYASKININLNDSKN